MNAVTFHMNMNLMEVTLMDIELITLIACFSVLQVCLAVVCVTAIVKLIPLIERKNEIKNKEIENKKFELFLSTSPEQINDELDKYFERYINRYIAFKFISKKATFINQDDTETMILDLTKLVAIEMSEIYIFYMKTIYAIDNQEDLIRYIKNRITALVVDSVSSYNKAAQISII